MHMLWRFIINLFKLSWNMINFMRICIFNIFLIFFIFIGINFWNKIEHHVSIIPPPKGALKLNLSGIIVDKSMVTNNMSKIGYKLLGNKNGRLKENIIFNIIDSIRQAKNDKNITGMILDLHNFIGGSQSSLEYIGKVLREFRESGKPIYAIGDNYTQSQYYLASYANKIYLSPQGSIDLHGFSINHFYYKKLLDKLKIHSNVFRVGTYKSAVEPFLRNDMSPEARADCNRWINQLWKQYLNTISINRNIKPNQVFPEFKIMIKQLIKMNGNMAKYALNNKLIDYIASRGDVDKILINRFGWNKKHDDYCNISIYNYRTKNSKTKEDNNVGVILVNGPIMDTYSSINYTNSYKIAEQIRSARFDKKIKAIILRVNSPGGSVSASEMIREELEATIKMGKPIIVSMGGIAASGGYWVSTASSYIIAHPSTLTGSIGIFGVVNTFEKTLDSIGIHSDGVNTSPLSDTTIYKNLSNEVNQLIKLNINRGYHNFIKITSLSRNKTINEIEAIAQGSTWTGNDAKNNGLIDQVGDFDDAIKKTSELAKLSHVHLKWYSNEQNFFNIIFEHGGIYKIFHKIFIKNNTHIDKLSKILKKNDLINSEINNTQKIYSICLHCSNNVH